MRRRDDGHFGFLNSLPYISVEIDQDEANPMKSYNALEPTKDRNGPFAGHMGLPFVSERLLRGRARGHSRLRHGAVLESSSRFSR